jgi:hypothetical protein
MLAGYNLNDAGTLTMRLLRQIGRTCRVEENTVIRLVS